MEDFKPNKYIFTDSFKTKDILWEAYIGYIDAYHNFVMLASLDREDPIDIATMNKYADYFYTEIEDFIDDFTFDNAEEIKEIFSKDKFSNDDYKTIRKFFAKFMKVSGIKNIVRESDDIGKSIEENR